MSKKTLRRALITSVVSLVLCFALLLGATYAWFTDTASTGVNTIASGNLDMVLEYYVPATADTQASWDEVTSDTSLFKPDFKFEPGAVQVAYVRVRNAGNLAFKYKLGFNLSNNVIGKNANGDDIDLTQILRFAFVEIAEDEMYADREAVITALNQVTSPIPSASGNLAPDDDPVYFALIVYMPETVGNEANHNGTDIPRLEFGIAAAATQDTVEADSFDENYDKNAIYPPTIIEIAGGTVHSDMLDEDVEFDTGLTFIANDDTAGIYANYLCDFVLTFNKDVDGAKVSLYGEHTDTGVIGATLGSENSFTGGQGVRVMSTLFSALMPGGGVDVTYDMVVSLLHQFSCYLHVEEPDSDLVATLNLVMTDPDTGAEMVISNYTYNFN